MKINLKFFSVFLSILPGFSCGQNALENVLPELYKGFQVEQIQPESLKPNFILLDTRENEEFEVSHLENAIFVGYNNFSLDSLKNFSKTDTFVVYCSVGYRSSKIIEKMKNAGFKNVSNLYGGIFYWLNKGFPVFRNGKKTKKVHPYNKFWGKFLNEKTPD